MRKFEKAIENKMLEGEALTDVEKRVYREAKLKQARKGKGPGRPFQMRKKSAKTFLNPMTQQYLNQRRDREMINLQNRIALYGEVGGG